VQKVLVGKPEEKIPLGRLRSRWKDSTETGVDIWLRIGSSGGLL
jgi:hypothetical protein